VALQDVSTAFAALGDPTRLAILARLAEGGEMTVQEVAQPFPISLPAVSQHLKVLEQAGLILRRRDGQRRPCRLRPERLAEALAWLNFTRQAWEARFDRLERFLADPPQPASPKGATDDRDP
jgi:DNA-binding transcriptional ArsR family regulator